MPDIKWIKITTNIFDDEKIKLIERLPEGDTILIIWIKLLVLAGRCNQCGMIYIARDLPYTEDTLTMVLNRPAPIVKLALDTFIRFQMIEISDQCIEIANWEKHQNIDGMELVREQSKNRMRKYRERKKLICDATVTQPLRAVTQENKSKNKNKRVEAQQAVPPALEDVQAYITSLNITSFTAHHFINFYDARGWMVGKYKMKDWRAAIRTWRDRERTKGGESYKEQVNKLYGEDHRL